MIYVSGFNFDSSDLTNDADINGTIVSGTPTYSDSQNGGKSFDMGSAVININVGENTNVGKHIFPFFHQYGHILEFELKVDSNATDGVILACDEINSNRAVWAISLVDTASTPKLKFCAWSEEEESSINNTHQRTFDITVPSGNGWNHYQLVQSSNSIYHRVNGGSQTFIGVLPLIAEQWNNPSGTNSVSSYEFETNIGRSQYGTLATNNTLSTGASATNCHLDWLFLHPYFTNGLDRNKTVNNITDQSYPEAKYFYGKVTSAEVIEISSGKEASTGAEDPISIGEANEILIPSTTAEVISVGPVVEAGGGEVQKEFWS